MFPEYRELISKLRQHDHRFMEMFEQHNALEQRIRDLKTNVAPEASEQIEALRQQTIQLKEQLYAHLQHKHLGV
jgi:uncharacterized protein YdcH (DUF465 family)